MSENNNDLTLDPATRKRLASRNYYNANTDKILSRQKALKSLQRQTSPWLHRAANAKNLAKKGFYLGTVTPSDMDSIRAMYQEAHETGRKVTMITHHSQGGKWELSNLQISI